MSVKLDTTSLGAFLKSQQMREMTREAADQIADQVNSEGITVGAFRGGTGEIPLPVQVVSETTDRAAATVVLAHPAGVAAQAKYGVLTKAASAVGLEVKGYH